MDSMTITLSKRIGGFTTVRGMDGISDQKVVDQVLAGDMDAFAILVERYQNRIYSAVLNYVYNTDDAVDITQEAFVRAYTKLRSFTSGSTFYTWLYRIAINAAIDFLRKRKSKPLDSLDDPRFAELGFEPVAPDGSSSPEKLAVRGEQSRIMRAAISSLSDKLRMAVVLHDVEGLSQEEVAEILQIPVGTVKSRISRGRAELRQLLSDYVGDLL